LKGKERVCHVTEADTPGAGLCRCWMCPKKCLHARLLRHGSPLARGLAPRGCEERVLPLCAAA
jgi:hypothetical protein